MKLKFLAEAKYTNPVKLAVHEILQDRMNMHMERKYVTDLDSIVKFKRLIDEDDYDAAEHFADEISGGNAIGLYTVLQDDYGDEVLPTIQAKGSIGLSFEEGVVGISARGPKDARRIAWDEWNQLDDGDEEDWF